VPPGTMPEGRIQYCQHHTPDLVWQNRWLQHANGATGLAGVLLCVQDAMEAARRYSRFSGLPCMSAGGAQHITTSRGTVTFVEPVALQRALGLAPPALPWIVGYVLETRDIDATREYVRHSTKSGADLAADRVLLPFPDVLGGIVIFQRPSAGALRFD
jgi:hypothetical protein